LAEGKPSNAVLRPFRTGLRGIVFFWNDAGRGLGVSVPESPEADYVIVGSGSAGAALAYRLSEDGRFSVIIIEAGGTDVGPFIQMPAALSYPMNMSHYDWGFSSMPEPALAGRRLATPRGRVIGGSSSINGMVYVRGHRADFDHWEEQGAAGWGADDVQPYFKRMENWHGGGEVASDASRALRGNEGPLHVTRGPRTNPLYDAFIRAGAEAGHPLTDDYNGSAQEGFGALEMTVWNGRRWSTANAYLRPALKRPNLRLIKALARRVVFDGRKATGVEVRRGSAFQVVNARREVILAASAINSPKLLLNSGIGPAEELRALGIDVIADRPGVGRNLQDHLEVYVQAHCLQPITLYKHWNLFSKGWIGANWLFLKQGLGTTNHFEAGAFIKSSPAADYPDIQFHFIPFAVRYDGKAAASGHGFQIHTGPMRSKARGSVRLATPNPEAKPEIRFNYMSHEDDFPEFRAAIRAAVNVIGQPAMKPFAGGMIQPLESGMSDAGLDDFIREHAESAYHPCGSCRMGAADDRDAVVDPALRVIGVEGLRVADSSIFPRVTYGNLNSPSIMTGEKAADHVLGRI
jgi:choline dehydrogenase